jgi:hypothetical protein
MIQWLEPTIRGGMEFTASTKVTAASQGTTNWLTVNATGTTESGFVTGSNSGTQQTGQGTNIGTITTSTSTAFSNSATYQNELIAYTSTTDTITYSKVDTTTTTSELSVWTASIYSGSNDKTSASFYTITSFATDKTTSYFETTSTITSAASTSTVVANVYDTVVLCEQSEIAMVQTQYTPWEAWDGIGMVANNTITVSAPAVTTFRNILPLYGSGANAVTLNAKNNTFYYNNAYAPAFRVFEPANSGAKTLRFEGNSSPVNQLTTANLDLILGYDSIVSNINATGVYRVNLQPPVVGRNVQVIAANRTHAITVRPNGTWSDGTTTDKTLASGGTVNLSCFETGYWHVVSVAGSFT